MKRLDKNLIHVMDSGVIRWFNRRSFTRSTFSESVLCLHLPYANQLLHQIYLVEILGLNEENCNL